MSKTLLTKELLDILEKKLTGTNSRSVHLNAAPRSSNNKLELIDFDKIDSNFSKKLINNIFNKETFSQTINIKIDDIENNKKTFKRLKTLARQNKDYSLEHGLEPFGFGYPIITKKDLSKNKIIYCPLLIWDLNISEDFSKANSFKISKTIDNPIKINEVLLNYIQKVDNVNFDNIPKEFLDDGIIDSNELLQLVNKFLSSFDVENIQEGKLNQIEKIDIEKYVSAKPEIINSGVFGMYLSQKESIINDVKNLRKKKIGIFEKNITNYQKFPFSPVRTDQSQQQILSKINIDNKFVIHGPPGTGKSQTLTAILSSALENNKTCLVVCEKRTALEVIENNLKEIGIGEFTAVIEDPVKDRRKVVDKARDLIDESWSNRDTLGSSINFFGQYLYPYQIQDRHLKNRDKIISKISDLHSIKIQTQSEILTGYNLPALVGYIDDFKTEDISVEFNLSKLRLKFNKEEFDKIENIFSDVKELIEILNPFNIGIKNYSVDFLKNCDRYSFDEFIENTGLKWIKELEEILINLKSYKSQKLNGFFITISSIFSKNVKELKNSITNLKNIFQEINNSKLLNSKIYYTNNKTELIKNIEKFVSNLQSLRNNKAEFNSLKSFAIIYYDQSITFRNILEHFAINENSKKLFRKYYFSKVIQSLKLDNVKDNGYPNILNSIDDDLEKIKLGSKWTIINTHREKREDQIKKFRRLAKYGEYITPQQIFAKVSNKKRRKMSLRQILESHFDLFSSIFPIVLTNPTSVSSMLSLEAGLFDVVLFDEASQLRIEDTLPSMYRGKVKIVSGDQQQMPPSDYFSSSNIEDEQDEETLIDETDYAFKESLLEFSIDIGFSNLHLDMHYRSKHPDLIAFSNAAFYKNRLVPLPPAENYVPIEFHNVKGLYENRTNIDEAKSIVKFLLEDANAKLSYGIATFNLDQRNLIFDILAEEIQKNKDYYEKYLKLDKNGLFIKNLENIQGDERDVIILSTTFGNDKDGKFYQRFGPINNKTKGYKLLNVIITRAKKKIILYTSVPQENIDRFQEVLEKEGISGKSTFYAYLSYCQAVSEKNLERKISILNKLLSYSIDKENSNDNLNMSLFKDVIIKIIHSLKSNNQKVIISPMIGGYKYDLGIKEENDYKLLIDLDGKFFYNEADDYLFDLNRRKIAQGINSNYYRLWSINFFNQRDIELNRIKDLIL